MWPASRLDAPYKRYIRVSILVAALGVLSCRTPAQSVAGSKPSVNSPDHADDVGILLGLYFPNQQGVGWTELAGGKWVPDFSSVYEDKYLTFWISRIDNRVNIQAVQGLLVPRPKGFWHAGLLIIRGPKNDIAGTEAWAAPIEAQPPPDKVDPQASTMFGARGFISYVGPQYLTYVQHSSDGAGHDNVDHGTASLDNLTQDLSLESVLGPGAVAEYRTHAKAVSKTSSKEDFCGCCWGRPEEWGLVHVSFFWRAYAIFRNSGPSICSQQSEEYWIEAPLPKSLAAGGALTRSWDDLRLQAATILKADQGVFDHFFVSPRGDLVVALTDNGIVVFAADGSQVTSVLRVDKFQSPSIPVMEQWATGRHVGVWQETVDKEDPAKEPAGRE